MSSIYSMAWIPVKMAAVMLGVSRQRVYDLAKRGALGWVKAHGTVLIARRSVEDRMDAKEARARRNG